MINLYEAKTQLSSLVDRAAGGEEIIIAKNGKPMARLVPLTPEAPRRTFGTLRGQGFWIGDDFDDPLPEEIAAVFRGERP